VLVALINCCFIRHALAKISGENGEEKDVWLFSKKGVYQECELRNVCRNKCGVRREDDTSW